MLLLMKQEILIIQEMYKASQYFVRGSHPETFAKAVVQWMHQVWQFWPTWEATKLTTVCRISFWVSTVVLEAYYIGCLCTLLEYWWAVGETIAVLSGRGRSGGCTGCVVVCSQTLSCVQLDVLVFWFTTTKIQRSYDGSMNGFLMIR
jgi:hypothetical protein